MQKREALLNPESCLNKAAPDEPLFILRANDPIAAQTIRHWVTMSQEHHEPAKLMLALMTADEFEKWRQQRYPAVTVEHHGR